MKRLSISIRVMAFRILILEPLLNLIENKGRATLVAVYPPPTDLVLLILPIMIKNPKDNEKI
jgi:hypothetical protein